MTLLELEQHVKALALPSDFVIFGSAPLLALGLVSTVNDIDLLATGAAWQKACELGKQVDADKGDRLIQLGEIDIYNGWMGQDAGLIFRDKVDVRGLPYAPLWAVLEYKRLLNRPKDKAHIALLERHLKIAQGSLLN